MYGYGYKYVNGLVVGSGGAPPVPPFANTKSLLFDGMDDYVDCGVISVFQSTANFSISCWLKVPDFSAPNNFFFGTFTSGSNTIYASVTNTQRLLFNFNNGYNAFSLPSIVAGQWHNVIFVFDGAINQLVTYIDGVGTTNISAPSSTGTSTANTSIGFVPFSNYFNGNIDEFAIYDYSLTQQNATDIYNLGTPNDLSLLATPPTNWYRNGDNGSWKSPQWLIPSNENKDKVSNYSYEFQGINSRQIDVGTVNVGTTNITSMWLKRNVVSTQQTLLGGSSATSPNYHMLIFTGNDFYVRYSPTVFVGWTLSNVTTILNDTINWINIVVVRTGDTVKLHLNGDDVGIVPDSFGGGTIGALNTQFTDIGADINGTFPVNGIVNNIAAWNVDTVLPSDIYNGGTPPDLTTLPTAPVNWWKMGEDATLIYTVNPNGAWTIPDSVGSNDGTTNTTSSIFARIGEAPNSTNNALSINMDFVDVVLDTPPT